MAWVRHSEGMINLDHVSNIIPDRENRGVTFYGSPTGEAGEELPIVESLIFASEEEFDRAMVCLRNILEPKKMF